MTHEVAPHSSRWIVLSVVVAIGLWLVTIGLMSQERYGGSIDIAAGSVTFRDHCGACHIVEKGISTHHGPNLYSFGKIAGTREPEMTAAAYILESILDPEAFVAAANHRGMPRNLASVLTQNEIRNVVAYLASQGSSVDYDEIRALKIPDLPPDISVRTVRRKDMELAANVLRERGGCLQCHTLYRNAEYTVFAPGLFGVGLSDEQLLRQSIVDPSKVVAPHHRWVNIYLENGKVVSGKRILQTADRVVLLTRSSADDLVKVEILMSDVEHEDGKPLVESSPTSPMPTGFDKLLTPQELDALVTMIRQLN